MLVVDRRLNLWTDDYVSNEAFEITGCVDREHPRLFEEFIDKSLCDLI